MKRAWWMAVLLLGCSKESAPETVAPSAATSSTASAPAPSAPAAVAPSATTVVLSDEPAILSVQGEKRQLGSAFVFTEGGTALKLVVSTHKRFCDNVRGTTLSKESREVVFGATIANVLDGPTQQWRQYIRENRLGPRVKRFAKPGEGGAFELLDGTASKGDTLRVKIHTKASGATLQGVVSAKGCGDLLVPRDPVPEPAGVKVRLADKEHVIRSVRVSRTRSGLSLSLSTAPLGCKDDGVHGDLELKVAYVDGIHPKGVTLVGDAYVAAGVMPGDLSKLKIDLAEDPATSDYPFTLAGEVAVGGYTLKVDTRGTATNCP